MTAILTGNIQSRLGMLMFYIGKHIKFRDGMRYAITQLDATQEHLKSGILPAVNQIEALNPHFQGIYDNDKVFGLCGGSTALDHYVLWLSHCQWQGCDAKHYLPFPIADNASVCVCRSCEHKLNIQEVPKQLVELSRQNRIAFILDTMCQQLGLPTYRQIGKWEVVGWCIERNLQSLLPDDFLHKLTGTTPYVSTGRECDVMPSYDPLELLNKRIGEVKK